MNNISCHVVKDLLPLYYDDVCSLETKDTIHEHMITCPDCKRILDQYKADIDLPIETIERNKAEGNGLQSIYKAWKSSKIKAFCKGMIIAFCICAVLYGGYLGLFQWNITKVSASVIQISDVSLLRDGRISYHVKMTDGYNVNQVHFKLENDGSFYMTPLRPIIKSKKFADIGLANTYDVIDLKQLSLNHTNEVGIQEIYYGTPEDRVLVWKKGMALPTASDAIEALFDN
ncbi:zf-HC2 domain-containing protein [Paenibacillus sp. 1001270B_150601_E10]|uniref:zf-HC2 domain-containing protein n=1 Tax=Paenibacillus sp. 1001270B_150601_E10 TaxID=2787079 RepID=UPI00189D5C2E|nr:zf-HC2 domain-containing protein [Paenibacillus sp. 1001270B_150601_E10]